jgi:uncharacterized protein
MSNPILETAPSLESIRAHRDEILALAEKYGAYNIRVFGSVARAEATPQSDLDVLVSFREGATLLDHAALQLDLTDLLGVNVDVISDHPRLTPGFRRRLERDLITL